MRPISRTAAFGRDLKRLARSGRYHPDELLAAITTLAQGMPLATRYRDHPLTGAWSGFRECHLRPDWLLIYQLAPEGLLLVRIGSHTDLFG